MHLFDVFVILVSAVTLTLLWLDDEPWVMKRQYLQSHEQNNHEQLCYGGIFGLCLIYISIRIGQAIIAFLCNFPNIFSQIVYLIICIVFGIPVFFAIYYAIKFTFRFFRRLNLHEEEGDE